jgi:hypothetical protein
LSCDLFEMTFSVVLWIILCQNVAILKGVRHNIRACLCDDGDSGGMWVQILSRSCTSVVSTC